jgi:hypothetical protein
MQLHNYIFIIHTGGLRSQNSGAGGEGPGRVDRVVLEGDHRRRQVGQRAQGHGGGDEAARLPRRGHRRHQVAAAPLPQAVSRVPRQHPPRPIQGICMHEKPFHFA